MKIVHIKVIPVSGDRIRGKFLYPNMSAPDMSEIWHAVLSVSYLFLYVTQTKDGSGIPRYG
jgi:hypothetical protein